MLDQQAGPPPRKEVSPRDRKAGGVGHVRGGRDRWGGRVAGAETHVVRVRLQPAACSPVRVLCACGVCVALPWCLGR